MSIFSYSGADSSGAKAKGWIEAATTKEARTLLVARGVTPLRLAPAPSYARLGPEARADFYRSIGTLIGAGFPLERALGLAMDEAGGDPRRMGLFAGIRDKVREGASLSDAIDSRFRGLPRFEKAVIAASERSGSQGKMLSRLAAQLDERREMDARLRSSLAYPAFVLCAGLGLASLMLYVVVPRAIGLLERAQGGAPQSALAAASVGRGVLTALLIAAGAAAIGIFAVRRRGRRDKAFAASCERAAAALPRIGGILSKLWSMRFAQTLCMMLQAGELAVEALPLASLATGSDWLASLGAGQAERVRNGASLSDAVRAMPPLAPNLAEWVRIGEMSGGLQEMLSQAAERCRHSFERSMSRALSLLEPALIVLVGLLVLAVALTVLVPMLDIAVGAAGA